MPSIPKARRTAPTIALATVALTAVALLTGLVACDGGGEPKAATAQSASTERPLTSTEDSTLYAVGQGLAGQFNLHQLFDADELAVINRGFNDAVLGDGQFDLTQHLEAMNNLVQQRRKARAGRLQSEGDAFVASEGTKDGAMTTESGLVYFIEREGTGPSPTASTDTVVVHYEGSFSNGTVFDSSYRRDEPTKFQLGQVIPGWQEGLKLLKVGSKARLVIPSRLGYGEQGMGQAIPPNVPLVFEVELLNVIKP
jgi:FKBP-type peptidyl-prolyl cis-trans isomerase FkpA